MNTFTDSNNVTYKLVPIKPNGCCGFNALLYCLTGSEAFYKSVINNSMEVFALNPACFVNWVSVGTKMEFETYHKQMHLALLKV